MGSLMVLGRAFFVLIKYQSFTGVCVKFKPDLHWEAKSIKVPLNDNITKQNNCWASILACQEKGVLIFVEPLQVCVTMEILTTCKGIHIRQYVIDGTEFLLKYDVQLHLSRLSNSQHYLQGLHQVSNNLIKSIWEVKGKKCAFICAPIKCNWKMYSSWRSKFPMTILYILSLMLSKDGSVWQVHSVYDAYFIQQSFFSHLRPMFEPLSFSLQSCCFSG